MTNTVCNEYKPDVIAQGDCINCGNGFEFHQKPQGACGAIGVMQLNKVFKRGLSPRKPQVKLTVIVNDRSGGIIPQVILIPGETQLHQLDEAVRKAVIEQTVHDGTCIMKVTYTP